jgi:class 3 adenylate cyclase
MSCALRVEAPADFAFARDADQAAGARGRVLPPVPDSRRHRPGGAAPPRVVGTTTRPRRPRPRAIAVQTVLADLTGFTAFSERLDPEDVAVQSDRPGNGLGCERYEGFVEKFVGDAVMAVFAPVAHEDDPGAGVVRCAGHAGAHG